MDDTSRRDKFERGESVERRRIDEKIYDASLKFGQIVRCLASMREFHRLLNGDRMELLIEDLVEMGGKRVINFASC